MRYRKAFEQHELYPGNAGLALEGKKGSCRVRIELHGPFGGARYRFSVGQFEEASGEVDSVKQAQKLATKFLRGC